MPKSMFARSPAAYMWDGKALPRCVFVEVLPDMFRHDGQQDMFMLQCQVTVSPVVSVLKLVHQPRNSVVRTAAACIALSGR